MSAPKKILVVDDEPDVIYLLQVHLEQEGYSVATAGNGSQALEKVAEQRPDLILMDQMMPQMTGLEATQKLKGDKATAQIPVVMLTAKGSYADMSEGWDAGIDLYLLKPVDLRELRNIIVSILQ